MIILQEPMDGISYVINLNRKGADLQHKTKRQASVSVKRIPPLEAKKIPVFWLYRNKMEGISKVCFCHEGAFPNLYTMAKAWSTEQ